MNAQRIVGVMLVIAFTSLGNARQINYATQIQPIFNTNCVGCHGGTANLFLESHASLMSGTSNHGPVVTAGNGSGSVLIQKLEGTASFGARMPDGGPFLSSTQINLIKTWIDQGARAVPTDVAINGASIPEGFVLHQNFPNPFNPTTAISFQLSAFSDVTLAVTDPLGRRVAVLVNERKQAGLYSVTFDASGLSSGIYFYTLKTGGFFQTKKMIVLE